MRNVSCGGPGRRAVLTAFAAAWLLVALSGAALAADSARPESSAAPLSALVSPSDSDDLVPAAPAAAEAAHSDAGLPAGAWVGIAVSIVIAVALLVGALPFILPKPPGSRSHH